jgi:hypothetical protein
VCFICWLISFVVNSSVSEKGETNVRRQERTKKLGSERREPTWYRVRESPRANAHRDSCGSSLGPWESEAGLNLGLRIEKGRS